MVGYVINLIFFLISLSLFIMGAMGNLGSTPIFLSVFSAILFLGVRILQGRKLNTPRHFGLYVTFLTVVLIHYVVYGGQIFLFELFFTGGLYWLMIVNNQEIFSKYFFNLLLILGFYMAILNFFSNLAGAKYLHQNLYHSISPTVIHNHLGDLWAIILVFVVYKMSVRVKAWHFILLVLGLVIVATSYSRSALLSLIAGAAYILYFVHGSKRLMRIFTLLLIPSFLLLLYFGLYKTTIFSRPYFLQSLYLFVDHPMGVGMGNFPRFYSGSSYTHNLILELVSGIGIFSISFIAWLVKVFKSFTQKGDTILYEALFLAIFLNFSFDITYVIPTMVWLWFAFLAEIGSKSKGTNFG